MEDYEYLKTIDKALKKHKGQFQIISNLFL